MENWESKWTKLVEGIDSSDGFRNAIDDIRSMVESLAHAALNPDYLNKETIVNLHEEVNNDLEYLYKLIKNET